MDYSKIDLSKNQVLARLIVQKAINKKLKNKREFEILRNKIIKEEKGVIFDNLYFIKAYRDLIKEKKIFPNNNFLNLIQKRSVRTLSGVAPVTVLTKPYPCPGKCIYCPTDYRMPKSYLVSQPAAQRAYFQKFDPYNQITVRLKALVDTGHEISKVELRIIGGTWSNYPKRYQSWFIKRCLNAMNEFDNCNIKKLHNTLKNAIKINETASVRCIGINIETRPDFINKNEIKRLREFGVTKVELGVQTIYDEIYNINNRGHNVLDVINATKLLKNSGFKVGYHIMPNLPGSNFEKDVNIFKELFSNPNYQPDYLKIYPCVVTKKAEIYDLFKKGLYKPFSDNDLIKLLYEGVKYVPEWCRIDRIARDIPANEIVGGFKISNIRQLLDYKFINEGIKSREIRSREIRANKVCSKDIKLLKREYDASDGKEIFLSFEDKKNDKIVALLRLRFCKEAFLPELKNAALIREIHVYGQQVSVGVKTSKEKQHIGYGSKLLQEAEKISKKACFNKIAVISGIGTREYYRKRGYVLIGSYMIKKA